MPAGLAAITIDSSQHHNSADYEQTQPARAKRSRRRV
jgi:hypothetical protein